MSRHLNGLHMRPVSPHTRTVASAPTCTFAKLLEPLKSPRERDSKTNTNLNIHLFVSFHRPSSRIWTFLSVQALVGGGEGVKFTAPRRLRGPFHGGGGQRERNTAVNVPLIRASLPVSHSYRSDWRKAGSANGQINVKLRVLIVYKWACVCARGQINVIAQDVNWFLRNFIIHWQSSRALLGVFIFNFYIIIYFFF